MTVLCYKEPTLAFIFIQRQIGFILVCLRSTPFSLTRMYGQVWVGWPQRVVFPWLGQRESPWNAWGHVRRLMCICGDGVAESRAVGQGLLDMDSSPFLALIIHRQLFPPLGQMKNSTLPLFSDITTCAPQTGITQSCLPKKFPSYRLCMFPWLRTLSPQPCFPYQPLQRLGRDSTFFPKNFDSWARLKPENMF